MKGGNGGSSLKIGSSGRLLGHEVAYKWESACQGPSFKGICYMGADRSALIL
jgi:hypothetical protein